MYVQNRPFLHISQYVHITLRMKKKVYIAQRSCLVNLLREMRVEAGLTQVDLAERIERDQTFVSKYESGQRRLDALELREICQAIGITLEEFARRLEKALK
ncbi:MAG TPA: helix-turn-helix transcriptional regulator [Pyrinomonadaceae bacterium]